MHASLPEPEHGPAERYRQGVAPVVGVPSFGERGVLGYDENTDTVECHVCGRRFRGLGNHVGMHGLTATSYRQAFGLCRGRALSGAELVQAQRDRQRAKYERSPGLRACLAPGQAMATAGQLWWRARAASKGRPPPEELIRERRRTLDAGHVTQEDRAEERLARRLEALGFSSLQVYFERRYDQDQASLDEVRAELRVGRGRLGRLLDDAGMSRRPTGRNLSAPPGTPMRDSAAIHLLRVSVAGGGRPVDGRAGRLDPGHHAHARGDHHRRHFGHPGDGAPSG